MAIATLTPAIPPISAAHSGLFLAPAQNAFIKYFAEIAAAPPKIAPPAMLPAIFFARSLLPTGWPVNSETFSSAVLLSAKPNVNVCNKP